MPSPYKTPSSGSSSGKRNGLIATAVAVVLIVIIGFGWAIQSDRDSSGEAGTTPGEGSSQSSVDPGDVEVALTDEYGLGVGNPDAPVKVEIFEDFQCPYCMQLEEATSDDLLQAAADGDAFVVYRPMAFLNEYSSEALNAFGVVLDVAGGEAALEFHDKLFANQPAEGGESPDTQWLIDLATESGADQPAVAEGIRNGDFEQWATNASDDASKRGVTGTPTVFVDGEPIGGNTIEEMADNLNAAIEEG